MSKKLADEVEGALDLDLDDVRICHACLSFVSFAIDRGDEREIARETATMAPDLWDDGLALPIQAALQRARRDGLAGAEAAIADVEERGPRSELRTGATVPVLSAEDVLIDRLHQFVAGGHSDVLEQSVALLGTEELEHPRLVRRAEHERLSAALIELERIRQRVRRGEQIPSYELHEIAKRLERQR